MTIHTARTTIRELDKPGTDAEVTEFHHTMLVPHFPSDEVMPLDNLVHGVREGRTRVLTVCGPDGAVLAGAVGEWFPSSRVQLLSYLVVRQGLRSQGLGSKVLSEALSRWTEALRPLLILGEVEDPRYFRDTGFGDVVGRVRLYERKGVRALPVPYAQPALGPGLSRVPGLMLMVFAAHCDVRAAEGTINGGVVEQFLTEYYTVVEGDASPDDPQLGAMRAACRAAGGLPLLLARELPTFPQYE
ncbi:MAG: hypothetical protein JO362_06650 [Streptomycetaceae bacterium]|nr:hypothetical protein [Streptomycetaceae bacterium]